MLKKKLFLIVLLFMILSPSFLLFAQENGEDGEDLVLAQDVNTHWKWIAAAIAVGLSCIAGGIAVGQVGSAAMGAMSENPELSGKALPYVGLAEGICLWGFLVALLILFV